MSEKIARIDELELYPIEGQDGLTWRPVRRHFDIQAFGVNAYTADAGGQAGGRGAPRGRRARGAVRRRLRPRAVHGRRQEHDAPAGTLVHCPPGTPRGAVAAEAGTTVLGIGAKPGEVFKPSGWEWTFAGMSLLNQGQEEAARREFEAGLEAYPDAWQGYYNLACAEARLGNRDDALKQLRRAAEIDQAVVSKYAPDDEDFASLKDDPEFLAITGQAQPAGSGS